MFRKNLIFGVFLIVLVSIAFAADPFYTSLLNEGKAQFAAGRLDEALESFKLAEFGLLDEKEYIPELYQYYALAQYKKGAIGEAKALLLKMKTVLGDEEVKKVKKPREIEPDLAIMTRALDYLDQPGAKPGMIPFLNLFYETWDLLRARQLEPAEARLKAMKKMTGDEARLRFLEGFLAFQKGDYKRCLSNLGRIKGPLPVEFGEDASFCLAYSYLKRGDAKEGEKWAQRIKNPEYVHRIMELMEEIKAGEKGKK